MKICICFLLLTSFILFVNCGGKGKGKNNKNAATQEQQAVTEGKGKGKYRKPIKERKRFRGNIDDNEVNDLIEKAKQLRKGQKTHSNAKGNGLSKHSSQVNNLGTKFNRYWQTFKGIKVWGADIVEIDQEEKLVDNISKETKERIGKKTLKNVNKKQGKFVKNLDESFADVNLDVLNNRTILQRHSKTFADGKNIDYDLTFGLFYEPVIFTQNDEAMPAFYVHLVGNGTDGKRLIKEAILDVDGELVEEWDGLQYSVLRGEGPGGNYKTGKKEYRDDNLLQITELGDGTCVLKTDKNLYTVDLDQMSVYSWMPDYPDLLKYAQDNAVEFTCFTNPGEFTNGAYSPTNDAHYAAQKVIDMISSYYGDTLWNGEAVILFVHCDYRMENAYYSKLLYSQYTASGYTTIQRPFMCIGDGASEFYPLVSVDVLAHEIAHGITDFNSALIYNGESGGLNEAFSDMSGMAVMDYLGMPLTFKIAESIMKSGGQLRCMNDPPCDGISIDNVNDISSANNDPHYTSGVFNKVFYLLASSDSSYKLKYGAWDAYDIFYMANKHKWTSTTNFNEAAEGVLEMAEDLQNGLYTNYNYDHLNLNNIKEVFKQVGIMCSKSSTYWFCY